MFRSLYNYYVIYITMRPFHYEKIIYEFSYNTDEGSNCDLKRLDKIYC